MKPLKGYSDENELDLLAIEAIEAIEPGLVLVAANIYLPREECAFALGRKIAEICCADSIALWSWQPDLELGKVQLLDVSWRECHRWTMPLLELVENSKAWMAWAGDYPGAYLTHYLAGCLNGLGTPRIRLADGAKHGVSVLDFRRELDLGELRNLNLVAKNCGMTAIVCATLYDAQNKPYLIDTYAELALRICVEHGVNLTDCATKIITLKEGENGAESQARVLD